MHPKKHLSFGSLIHGLSKTFLNLEDHRQQTKNNYTVHDALMSGFACMYFQDPSLLQFQERLSETQNRDNLETLFGVKNIPKDTQLRNIIDSVESEKLSTIFKDYFFRLQRGKHLSQYQLFPGLYVCSIDGTQYFSSKNIRCDSCLTTTHENGETDCSHKVLQAAVMHPNLRQVIPLMPEEIKNSDGSLKQDCEINAAKRLIPKIKKDHPQLGLIIVGDDLFSRQPFMTDVLSHGYHYIFTVKFSSHPFLEDWISAYEPQDVKRLCLTDDQNRKHTYEWVNHVPLNDNKETLYVNFFRYQISVKNENGQEETTYKNVWVTDLEITQDNVPALVKGARCKWKIENECFNTLKNQGYCIEHNYGHGKNNLCFNFYLLTLLAFFFHQIFELTDLLYQACRKKFGSKRNLWENLRIRIRIFVFDTWEHLLNFSLAPSKYKVTLHPL